MAFCVAGALVGVLVVEYIASMVVGNQSLPSPGASNASRPAHAIPSEVEITQYPGEHLLSNAKADGSNGIAWQIRRFNGTVLFIC